MLFIHAIPPATRAPKRQAVARRVALRSACTHLAAQPHLPLRTPQTSYGACMHAAYLKNRYASLQIRGSRVLQLSTCRARTLEGRATHSGPHMRTPGGRKNHAAGTRAHALTGRRTFPLACLLSPLSLSLSLARSRRRTPLFCTLAPHHTDSTQKTHVQTPRTHTQAHEHMM